MKKLICILTFLPVLAWVAEATGLTLEDESGGKSGAAVVESGVSAERLAAYKRAGDWHHYGELVDATMVKYPPKYGEHVFAEAVGVGIGGDVWSLNSIAWDVFRKCDDKGVLKQALSWSELSIELDKLSVQQGKEPAPNMQYWDTKANLLYKLGRVDEAITSEQAAIAQGIANAKQAGRAKGDFFDDYSATVEKMKKGEPTWPAKN